MRISFKNGDCPECGDESLLPSRTRGIENVSKLLLPFNPYRCSACNTRFWAPRSFKSYISNLLYILVFLGLVFLLVSQQRLNRSMQQQATQSATERNSNGQRVQQLISTPQAAVAGNQPKLQRNVVSEALEFERELDALEEIDDEIADTLARNGSLSQRAQTSPQTSLSRSIPVAMQEPSANKEPSAGEKTSAGEKPSADQRPSNNQPANIASTEASVKPQKKAIVQASLSQQPTEIGEETPFLPQLAGLDNVQRPVNNSQSDVQPVVNESQAKLQSMVLSQLENWRDAWQTQNIARYLASYSFRFESEKGAGFSAWRKQRSAVLKRPEWIRIKVSNSQVTFSADKKTAVVSFTQDYAASNYQDVSQKTMTLSREGDNWNITRELSE